MEFIRSEYEGAFKFLKSLRWAVLALLIIFMAVSVASHFIFAEIYQNDPAQMKEHLKGIIEMIESKNLTDESGQISAFGLFCNNFIASGFAVVIGAVPFLFVPLLTLIFNAALIGMLSAIMLITTGSSGTYQMFVSVAPHGIFEIPALIICVAMGITLCKDISARILRRKRSIPFLKILSELVRLTVLVVVPMLMIAAVLEAYLTPFLIELLL